MEDNFFWASSEAAAADDKLDWMTLDKYYTQESLQGQMKMILMVFK